MVSPSSPRLLFARLQCHSEVRRAALAALSLVAILPTLAHSQVPQGSEFQVNTSTTGNQFRPSVSMNATGDFVIAWQGPGIDGAHSDIHARPYSPTGTPRRNEFRVGTTTTGFQSLPTVAIGADGDFAIAWEGRGTDGTNPNAFAMLYAADGTARGGEFSASGSFPSSLSDITLAMEPDGDFVVAWASANVIYAQRFTASGSLQGARFRVDSPPGPSQLGSSSPSAAVDAAGDLVIAWTFDTGSIGTRTDVRARRFNAANVPVGSELQVNTYTTKAQSDPSVAIDADGNFVVTWTSFDTTQNQQDGSGSGIYAQRYAASGTRVGGEFRVNTFTTGNQDLPSVAMNAAGDFVVVWASAGQDGSGSGVYAQGYTAAGAPRGSEFRVNTFTPGDQIAPSVSMDGTGHFVVAWYSSEQDGSDNGIYAQRYSPGSVASEPGAASGLSLLVVPNPVGNRGTSVQYSLPTAQHVRLSVYDVLGREVAMLHDGDQGVGPHEARFAADGLSPGVYLVRLDARAETVVRRVTVAR